MGSDNSGFNCLDSIQLETRSLLFFSTKNGDAQTVATSTCPTKLDVLFPFRFFSVNNAFPTRKPKKICAVYRYQTLLSTKEIRAKLLLRWAAKILNFLCKKVSRTKSDTKEILFFVCCVKSILWIANCLRFVLRLCAIYWFPFVNTQRQRKKLNEFRVLDVDIWIEFREIFLVAVLEISWTIESRWSGRKSKVKNSCWNLCKIQSSMNRWKLASAETSVDRLTESSFSRNRLCVYISCFYDLASSGIQ